MNKVHKCEALDRHMPLPYDRFSHRIYWRHKLVGAQPKVGILPDYARTISAEEIRAEFAFCLPEGVIAGIRKLTGTSELSTYVVLLAGVKVLLHKYTGNDDILIGSPAYRERCVGHLVPLRTRITEDMTFKDVLLRVRRTVVEGYSHQHFPVAELVGEPEVVVLLEEIHDDPGTECNDLTFSFATDREGVEGIITFNTALFGDETITQLAKHYVRLMILLLDHLNAPIAEVSLVSAEQEDRLLNAFNGKVRTYPVYKTLHQLFQEQVGAEPERAAAVHSGTHITYTVLNEKANEIALLLRRIGLKRNDFVGILEERGIDFLVAMLGVLKAGGAYLPLDPGYPEKRVQYMVADSQIHTLITRSSLVEKISLEAEGVCLRHILCFDRKPQHDRSPAEAAPIRFYDCSDLAREEKTDPIHVNESSDLAYMLYTSGSTGLPKGAMIRHDGAINHIYAQFEELSFHRDTAFLQSGPSSSDISVWQFLAPLLIGGRTVIVEHDTVCDPVELFKVIRSQQVTLIELVPAVLKELLEYVAQLPPEARALPALEWAMVCGEAVSVTLANQWLQTYPTIKLVNAYGPTEAADDISQLILDKPLPPKQRSVPIGKPLANLTLYVLDRNLKLVPVSVPGEICVSGIGVGEGYWRNEEKTSTSFVTNPYAGDGRGSVLYLTGDLGRWLPDGTLEFLGRLDHQVKVRGFRVELGEIESVLAQHYPVKQAVVIAREDKPGKNRLVAYITPRQEQAVDPSELRRWLKETLPDYMLPSAFVTLDALPLAPSGKVDHRALPAPDTSSFSLGTSFVPPRTPTEEILVAIWADILGVEVGIHDNFFELGGHSLLVTQVISRLREAFSVDLPLRRLFEFPTVVELSESIEATRQTGEGLQGPGIEPVLRSGELPLSFAQQRLWFLDQLEGSSATYNMPDAVRLSGPLHVEALEQSLTEIVRRHEVLRTTFPMVNGVAVQFIAPTLTLTLPVVDLQALPEVEQSAEVQRLTTEEAKRPFDLANGPLLRVTLLRLGEEEHVLLLTIHHIVYDDWSMGIFIRELSTLYEAFLSDQPSPLPELPIQYADFAHWQRQLLTGEVLETQLTYWKQQLGGSLPVLQLPTDYPRPPVQNYRGAQQSLVLFKNLTEALKALSRREGSTLFMTLLAAFKTLLYRYTGQEDIIVGSPIAGRNRAETEELIGLFLNSLALRTYLGGNPSFRELLGWVREVALGAYDHQEMPFEKLVEELQPERNLSRHPVFDVMFNFINTPKTALEFPGLTLSSLELIEPESKFLMTLYVQEQGSELSLRLVYQQALFSAERMACFLNQFQYLLEQIVAAPESPIQFYSLVTPEFRQLLPDPNAVLPEPRYEPVTTLFTSWVNRTPAQPAVCQGDRTWTYSELAESAHALARVLLAHGVERGDVIAVFGSRSFGLIASMMGVFLSGGVLLTLDQNLPLHRQQLMLQEAKAKRLLNIGGQQPEDEWIWESLDIICVDPDTGGAINSEKDSGQAIHLPELTPDDATYIFFTSGSTGVPKGVLGCHKGISQFLNWQRQTFTVGPQDRIAQLIGLSFDAVLRDVFLPLTSGATLCLPTKGDDLGPARILPWLEREQISLIHTVPSLAQSWLVNVPPGVSLRALRWVFFAGEPLTETLVRRWREAFPEAGEIVNLYGATETTLVKCYYWVPSDMPPGVQLGGWPLPETQALVLTENSQLCGIGESGEIVLRTPFRSLGYINAPEENQQRFVKNPFRNDKQDLLYYTGDRGRYRPDGSLEILGRLDNQVKIRGVRIEPGEIETVLGRHPAVWETVVIAWEDHPEDKRLVAYVVPNQEQVPIIDELRRFLKQKLPDYMVPSAFVMLDALPLTPNGKVNRRALPAPELARPELTFVAPRTLTEEMLARIWAEVLSIESFNFGRSQINIYDNFFDLGGHSLVAARLISQVREVFQVELPLRHLFEFPTIAGLAMCVESERQTNMLRHQTEPKPCSSLLAIQPGGSKRPFFLLPGGGGGEGEFIIYAKLVYLLGQEQPVYGLQARGLDGKQEPHTQIEAMAADYIKEIRTLQPEGPYLLGGECTGGVVALEMAQQLQAQGQKVALLVLMNTQCPTNIRELGYRARILLKILQIRIISYHLSQLVQLESEERLPYIFDKARKAKEKINSKFHLNGKHLISPPPPANREFRENSRVQHINHVRENYYKIIKHYRSRTYSRRITLLVSEDHYQHDPTMGWNHLAAGGLEIYKLLGDHDSYIGEYVQTTAEKLKACLDAAQADN